MILSSYVILKHNFYWTVLHLLGLFEMPFKDKLHRTQKINGLIEIESIMRNEVINSCNIFQTDLVNATSLLRICHTYHTYEIECVT